MSVFRLCIQNELSESALTRIAGPSRQIRTDGVRGQDGAFLNDHEVFYDDEFALSRSINQEYQLRQLCTFGMWKRGDRAGGLRLCNCLRSRYPSRFEQLR